MQVEDINHLLETLHQWITEDPRILTILARVVPVTQTFAFQTVEEFETEDREASLTLLHRRGTSRRGGARTHR
jgi:hypothetical protein